MRRQRQIDEAVGRSPGLCRNKLQRRQTVDLGFQVCIHVADSNRRTAAAPCRHFDRGPA
jgi:hypothetical protein